MTTSELTADKAQARLILAFLMVLMAVAAFIRVQHADVFYYNADEAMHTSIASGADFSQVLAFSHFEVHPPLLYFFEHYWMMVSIDPAFVRGLPLVFGLLLIPLYYRIGELLGGALAGISCASLMAFSHGCIIQSYVVRQYIVFLFFISLALYCYLLWRKEDSTVALTGYGLFSILACLSHFSGIFDVACIAIFGMLWHEKRLQWLAVNLVVATIALYAYYLWQPILLPLKSYFAVYAIPSSELLTSTLTYPFAAARYILPGQSYIISDVIIAGLALCLFYKKTGSLRPLTGLTVIGLTFGMFLFAAGIYPQAGSRRSLWLLPLLLPQAGLMIAFLLQRMLPASNLRLHIATLALFALGILSYHAQTRFEDGMEYVWQQNVWNDFSRYMATLGPKDLVVTEKDDGIMLANLYRNMGDDALSGKVMAKLAPYRGTNILFNPYYPRNYSTAIFLQTLAQGNEQHLLDGREKLVFLRMAWSQSPLTDLMLCAPLDKKVITFPDFHEPINRDDIERARAAVMLISKKSLLEDVLAQDGKARACLNGRHDMVPNLKPAAP